MYFGEKDSPYNYLKYHYGDVLIMKRYGYLILLTIGLLLLLSLIVVKTIHHTTENEKSNAGQNNEGNKASPINKEINIQDENNTNQAENSDVERGKPTMPKKEKAIDEIIEKMTLEEKVGQMIIGGVDSTIYTEKTKSLIADYKLGGIILFKKDLETTEQSIELLNQIKLENKRNILPLFLGVDQEGGRVERLPDEVVSLPTNKVIGEKNDEQFSYNIGTILGDQLNAYGFNLNFAPVLDVNSNPNNPVIGDRSFSNDPEVVSRLGIKTMQGMQSKNIVTAVKHFPGHGDTSVDSHLELPTVEKSLAEIEEMELIPFKRAIETGVDIVMSSHILLPQIDPDYPASMSKRIIDGLLREQLGYKGVVVSDDMTMLAITNNFDIGDASVAAVNAGTDLVIVAHGHDTVIHVIETLKKAILEGKLTEERIIESVRRIIRLKQEREITNEIVESVDIEKLNEKIRNVLD